VEDGLLARVVHRGVDGFPVLQALDSTLNEFTNGISSALGTAWEGGLAHEPQTGTQNGSYKVNSYPDFVVSWRSSQTFRNGWLTESGIEDEYNAPKVDLEQAMKEEESTPPSASVYCFNWREHVDFIFKSVDYRVTESLRHNAGIRSIIGFCLRSILDMRSSGSHQQLLNFGRGRPPVNWLLLCFISFLALIVILGSSSSSTLNSIGPSSPVADIYKNYRRLKEQARNDFLEIRSLSSGLSRSRELELCGKEKENYVPCYNVSASVLAGFNDGEEFGRHCDVSRVGYRCLVRPLKDYNIPLRWPSGRDVIWSGNVKIAKDQFLASGSLTKRLMLLEENQIAFHSEDGMNIDGVKNYSRQIAEMIRLGSDSNFVQAGVRTVLDIGCGFGSFGAHLLSLNVMTVCTAAYENSPTGSPVQDTPRKYVFPEYPPNTPSSKQGGLPPLCKEDYDAQAYYQPLQSGISGTTSKRWVSMQNRSSGLQLSSTELAVHGVHPEYFLEDSQIWRSTLRNYWSLLTPLIFSDHPKRPSDEDPLPPFNMIRNVMDMNAHYGGLNAAFVEAEKSAWVMNVVPIKTTNTLPLILDQGFAGVLHDWCVSLSLHTLEHMTRFMQMGSSHTI
ncbi:hypothetical protein GIB67_009565, partial [Kingdonia uniflora]